MSKTYLKSDHFNGGGSATLYLLGFNFLGGDLFSGEIAGIKGDMTIKLVHPPGEELKFVVELPGEKQMAFSVDRYQILRSSSWPSVNSPSSNPSREARSLA